MQYKCGSCGEINTGDAIDETTVNDCCMNRQQRRSYVSINKTSKSDRKWYKCPSCGQNIRRIGWEEI